jgi:hypothetical protein
MTRYDSRKHLANKIDWEGGLMESLDYGIRSEDMPDGDTELTEAWQLLETSYWATAQLARRVQALLPEPGDPDE